MRKVEIIVKIVKKGNPRDVVVRTDGKTHKVVDLIVGDDTGVISMSLWDEMVNQIQENDIIQISNGYVGMFGSKIQLNIGKFGKWARLNLKEYDMDVYLEEVSLDSTASASQGESQFIKVAFCLQRPRGINLLVRVVKQLPPRTVTTRRDGKEHIVNTFLVGDETACINFDLWDQGEDISEGDILEIRGAYTREFNKILSLNLSRTGSYEKSSEEIPEVNTSKNISEAG